MEFVDGFEISSLIDDPVKNNSTNINGSRAIFFHGTRKEILPQIIDGGFLVEPKRPVFTFDPLYSMGYCRKSESYLRGLIRSNNKAALKKEIDELAYKKVITENDLKDTEYQWWINKANEYYEKTAKIVDEGVLLIFYWPIEIMEEAQESHIIFRKDSGTGFLEGAPSYWRTRQYSYGTKVSTKEKRFSIIDLDDDLVKQARSMSSNVSKGKFDIDSWNEFVSRSSLHVSRDIDLGVEQLKVSYCSQVVESRLLRELRDLFVGVLKERGLKVYWNRNGKFLEDPRWSLSKAEISERFSNLENNRYPYEMWKEYQDEKLSIIREFM